MTDGDKILLALVGIALVGVVLYKTTSPVEAAINAQDAAIEDFKTGPSWLVYNQPGPYGYGAVTGNVMPTLSNGQIGEVAGKDANFSMQNGYDCGCT